MRPPNAQELARGDAQALFINPDDFRQVAARALASITLACAPLISFFPVLAACMCRLPRWCTGGHSPAAAHLRCCRSRWPCQRATPATASPQRATSPSTPAWAPPPGSRCAYATAQWVRQARQRGQHVPKPCARFPHPPAASLQDVLRLCGIPQLLDAALDGYNATVLAYGQTGSGKTFTMAGRCGVVVRLAEVALVRLALRQASMGLLRCLPMASRSPLLSSATAPCAATAPRPAAGREDVLLVEGYKGDSDDGIVTRSLDYLFRAAARRAGGDGCRYTLRVSCAEIYNEQIHDLIPLDKKPLQARGLLAWGAWHGAALHAHSSRAAAGAGAASAHTIAWAAANAGAPSAQLLPWCPCAPAGAVGRQRRLPRARPAEEGVCHPGGCAAGAAGCCTCSPAAAVPAAARPLPGCFMRWSCRPPPPPFGSHLAVGNACTCAQRKGLPA